MLKRRKKNSSSRSNWNVQGSEAISYLTDRYCLFFHNVMMEMVTSGVKKFRKSVEAKMLALCSKIYPGIGIHDKLLPYWDKVIIAIVILPINLCVVISFLL